MFASVLIANRGEIACRIAHTARRLGMKVIAVHSSADRQALHVKMADQAVEIGPGPARESYLRADRIIAAARQTGAQCIHPGYGFLSENPEFADACAAAGVAFVGPTSAAMRAMGLKDAAKALMAKAGVPVVPGYAGDNQDADFLRRQAEAVKFPVMIKAVAGGGGKGMRRVDAASNFADALASCQREAKAAFGDDRVLIEKFVNEPRHIEVQILGDQHGNCVHLLERDCSLQRRHQKVIEEAPAARLSPALREMIGEAAVKGAKAVGYSNAGTMEFILGKTGDFYFMEMNTRLQVEHPVTEMITGFDLVEQQFRIAAGEKLAIAQEDVKPRGHAIEARLYAESPEAGFLPQTGKLHELGWPKPSPDLRVETGVEEGDEITPFYDPMIAKLIAWGETREEAQARLVSALTETSVLGLQTNQRFLRAILQHPSFDRDPLTTSFIDSHLEALTDKPDLARAYAHAVQRWIAHHQRSAGSSPWDDCNGWSLAGLPRKDRLDIVLNGEVAVAEYDYGAQAITVRRAGETYRSTNARSSMSADDGYYDSASGTLFVPFNGYQITVRARQWPLSAAADGGNVVKAPMPGKVLKLLVREDDAVEPGQGLLILEAMKMEHTLKAGMAARVTALAASEGMQVKEGDILCSLTPSEGT